jgi:glycosyltransferase involved in cell wall biosynthesis
MLASDAVIMPSISEPLGLVALEAMAMKKLLVASSADGLGEIVGSNTAIVVIPGSADSLADGVSRALTLITDEPSQYKSISDAGRRHVEDHFSPAAFGKKISEVYRLLTHTPKPEQ